MAEPETTANTADEATSADQGNETPKGEGASENSASAGDVADWKTQVLGALAKAGAAAVSIGGVALIGNAVAWVRFDAANLPTQQAVTYLGRSELIVLGASTLVGFIGAGVIALAAAYAIDNEGSALRIRTRYALVGIVALEVTFAICLTLNGAELIIASSSVFAGAVLLIALTVPGPEKPVAQPPPEGAVSQPPPEGAAAQPPPEGLEKLWLKLVELWARFVELVRGGPEKPEQPESGPDPEFFVTDWLAHHWPFKGRATPHWGIWTRRIVPPIALAVILVLVGIIGNGENWFALAFYGLALFLGLICLGTAWQTGGRFLWYGVSIFLAVVVFGAGVVVIRTYHTPKLQPMVALVKTDAGPKPIDGVYVGQSRGRLYYGSVKQMGRLYSGSVLQTEPPGASYRATTFISSVSCDQVVRLGVGSLVSLDPTSLRNTLRDLQIAVVRQPVPAGLATPPESGQVQSTKPQGQSGTTTAPTVSTPTNSASTTATSTNSTSTTATSSGGSSSEAGGCFNGSD